MITNISLINFRSHINTAFDFEPGVNVIVGPNGSGKTSILLALQAALFGSRPLPLKHMVNRGASTAWIKVTLDNGTSIARAFGEESSYHIVKGEHVIATGAKECEAKLQAKFGNLRLLVAAPQANQLYPLNDTKQMDNFFDFSLYSDAFKYLLYPLRDRSI
jgi:DNA repair exonuclease SbcCD ATPase subunit